MTAEHPLTRANRLALQAVARPYYQDEAVTLYHGRAEDVLPDLRASGTVVDCVIADPPYNIGKAPWDKITDYDQWSSMWINRATSLLSPPGAFWLFHNDPLALAKLVEKVAVYRNGFRRNLVSWITLDKSSWGIAKRYANAGSKTFPASVEYATYSRAEVYATQIRELRESLGLTRAEFDIEVSPSRKPTGITYRWEFGERIPQPAEVDLIREKYGVQLQVPTFNNPDKFSAVWQFPQVDTTDHPTPKPLSTVERMVAVTSNPGDLILDPFVGSGTTLVAARNLGRRAIGIDADERYCEVTARRLSQGVFNFGEVTA